MTSDGKEIRVLVVADDPLARAGLAAMLTQHPGCDVVGQAPGDAGVSDAIDAYRPDALVWDMGWQPSAALELLADVRDDGVPVVALLADTDDGAEAWAGGVRCLLPRTADSEMLFGALVAAVNGVAALHPDIASSLFSARQPSTGTPVSTSLTPRELEVLRLLGEGLSNKAIAFRLDISEHTVKYHVNSIMSKLGAESRTEAVVLATRLGLLPL